MKASSMGGFYFQLKIYGGVMLNETKSRHAGKNIIQILFFALLPLIATFSQPSIEWLKSIGTNNIEAGGYSIQKTLDGGYILIGVQLTSYFKPFIAKLDSTGDTLWTKTYHMN